MMVRGSSIYRFAHQKRGRLWCKRKQGVHELCFSCFISSEGNNAQEYALLMHIAFIFGKRNKPQSLPLIKMHALNVAMSRFSQSSDSVCEEERLFFSLWHADSYTTARSAMKQESLNNPHCRCKQTHICYHEHIVPRWLVFAAHADFIAI